MPKVSLVLGRKTLNVFDVDEKTIRIGRAPEMDIPIDNVSVSRAHAEIFMTDGGWAIRDLDSSNGTFVNGEELGEPRRLSKGDEVSIGKFSLFFDRVVGEGAEEVATKPHLQRSKAPDPPAAGSHTTYIKPHEVKEMLESQSERRKAALEWRAGDLTGERKLPEQGALLVGTGELCDLRTPKGPKHHLLLTRMGDGWEARNLSWWHGMKVNGSKTARARLADGDRIEIAGLALRYSAAVT